jgi:hypothetical protein
MPEELGKYGDLAALEDALEEVEALLMKLAEPKRRR